MENHANIVIKCNKISMNLFNLQSEIDNLKRKYNETKDTSHQYKYVMLLKFRNLLLDKFLLNGYKRNNPFYPSKFLCIVSIVIDDPDAPCHKYYFLNEKPKFLGEIYKINLACTKFQDVKNLTNDSLIKSDYQIKELASFTKEEFKYTLCYENDQYDVTDQDLLDNLITLDQYDVTDQDLLDNLITFYVSLSNMTSYSSIKNYRQENSNIFVSDFMSLTVYT